MTPILRTESGGDMSDPNDGAWNIHGWAWWLELTTGSSVFQYKV